MSTTPRTAKIAAPRAADLLAWYDRHAPILPWRARLRERADPYRVWLSEIMLQQTTVPAVMPYFARFIALWPDIRALAAAELDAVLHAWQGLGYYARARNLHACARAIVARHDGRFPASEAALRELPGIGDYTAAAIAAIAFGLKATAVDGNVERVMARIYAVRTPLPDAKPELRRRAALLTPDARAGDYAQAVMDLGATICLPKRPKCILCPWRENCAAHKAGIADSLPARRAKAEQPRRYGIAFWAIRADGAVLLRRRPEKGLLGGMMEVPSTEWRGTEWHEREAKSSAPVSARWRLLPEAVHHSFTHFHLELRVMTGAARDGVAGDGVWVPVERLGEHALPSVMKKVIAHALGGWPALQPISARTR